MASQWAPHRRGKKEAHKIFEDIGSDLDSMPLKELKKVMTPCVLHGDRDAIRMITKRIQTEETWKLAWKEMEKARREETRTDLEHRMAYNAMLSELSGQPGRQHNANHRVPNNCTLRLEEIAKPSQAVLPDDITKRSDFAGLYHVEHRHAIEALYPGSGHALTTAFTREATERASPGWPPPDPPLTPRIDGQKATQGGSQESVKKASSPVSPQRLAAVHQRRDPEVLAMHATEQFQKTEAPPAPDQNKSLLNEPLANDSLHMSLELQPRSDHTSSLKSLNSKEESYCKIDQAPPVRSMVYPVSVKAVEENMESPNWRPKRTGRLLAAETPRERQRSAHSQERWPPIGSQSLDVTLIAATGLPKSDRAGHSDPFAIAEVMGKARSKAKTAVINDTENPVWNQPLVVRGWRKGEPLVLSVYDKDLMGAHELLAKVHISSDEFYPHGVTGRIEMENCWVPEGRIDEEIRRYNVACRPTIEFSVSVRNDVERGGSTARHGKMQELLPDEAISMPGIQPSLGGVCAQLDSFEASLKPIPRLGNFWMSPR